MQKAACICPALLCHYWMSVTVETGAARSNSRDETQQIWMSRQCLGSLFFWGGFQFIFSAEANGKETIIPSGCDPEL